MWRPWRMVKPWWLVAGLWGLWLTGPYLAAWWLGRQQGLVFAGFLHNPYDNFTYLAKMWQGWRGAWVYRLAFTVEPGPGAPIFLFYLALGHVARLTQAPLLAVYHGARLLAGGLLFAALVVAARAWFPHDGWSQRFAVALTLFGSGLGWLVFPWARENIPPDMSIPEAFPYLAAITTPHFLLAQALLVALIAWPWRAGRPGARRAAWWALAGVLSVIYPFGVVVALAALAVGGLPLWWWQRLLRRGEPTPGPAWARWPEPWRRAVWVALGGLPYPLYALWALRQDPTLVVWNAQNVTPSGPWWLMLLAVSPALPVAWWLAWEAWGQGRLPAGHQSPTWAWGFNSVVLTQLPLALQRRFFVGAYVAAAWSLSAALAPLEAHQRRRWARLVWALSLPSTLLTLVGLLLLAARGSPLLYLYPDEVAAFAWVREHTPAEARFLASEASSARLAAFTGRRVFVGHPLETPHPDQEDAFVRRMLCQPDDPQAKAQALQQRGMDYLFVGPREREMCAGAVQVPPDLQPRFTTDTVTIYGWAK